MKKKPAIPRQRQNKQPGIEAKMHPQPEYLAPYYRGCDKLAGKTAIITGGDSGIGRAVACAFALEGADVIVHYLNEEEDAHKTKQLVEEIGTSCWIFSANLQRYKSCESLIKKVQKICSHPNILVNNCAEQHPHNQVEDIDIKLFEETFKTNFFSYFYMIKAILPLFEQNDVIINTASVTAYKGSHHLMDYSATKGAIVSLTRSLSQSLVNRGIRVNAVAPGPVWTPLIPASFSAKEVTEFGTQVPMKRAAQPYEIAPSYVFLASSDSSYMTGQVLHPNGGVIVNG